MNNMTIEKKRHLLVTAYFLYLAFYYAVTGFEIEPFASHESTLGVFGNLIAVAMLYHGMKSHPQGLRKPWAWFLSTAVLYTIGEALWAFYEDFLGLDPSSPSICDVFYLGNSFTSLYAGICYLRQIGVKAKDVTFDVVLSLFAIGGLMYHFVLLPIASTWEENAASVLINSIISLIDLSFFVTLILIVFGEDEQILSTKRALLLAFTFIGFLAIDQGTMLISIYSLETPAWVEPLWAVPMFLLGLASMYPETEDRQKDDHPQLERAISYGRILLPYILTFAILVLIGVQLNITHSLFIWAVLLVILMSVRQVLVLMRNRTLVEKIRDKEKELNRQNYELKQLNRQILRDAEIDFLTQLANRRFIDSTFARLAPPDGVETSLGVLLIDVDKFKNINDTYGHPIGDLVLQRVAGCISEVIRGKDIAGRFGGDEFIILLPGADRHATALVAERLMGKISKAAELASRNVTLSIGCTNQAITKATYNSETLLKEADEALYAAKEGGRNRFVVYGEK